MIYLVEAYGIGSGGGYDDAARAVEAGSLGTIRYLAAIPVPGDDVVFRLFRSDSREALVGALEAAAVRFDRISEVDASELGELGAAGIRDVDRVIQREGQHS